MKPITTEKLVEMCDTTAEQFAAASQLLGKTFTDTAWMEAGIQKGFYRAETLRVNGVARFVLVFHVNDQRVLFVNAAAQLTRASEFDALIQGVFALAKKYGCAAIETMTLRAGLLKQLLAHGFKPIGVSVQCPV